MVSWLFEVFAWRNGTFPSYVRPVGGVMLSGGAQSLDEVLACPFEEV